MSSHRGNPQRISVEAVSDPASPHSHRCLEWGPSPHPLSVMSTGRCVRCCGQGPLRRQYQHHRRLTISYNLSPESALSSTPARSPHQGVTPSVYPRDRAEFERASVLPAASSLSKPGTQVVTADNPSGVIRQPRVPRDLPSHRQVRPQRATWDPDPRGQKGQKWPFFRPLRCKVVGEWGGSAH